MRSHEDAVRGMQTILKEEEERGKEAKETSINVEISRESWSRSKDRRREIL